MLRLHFNSANGIYSARRVDRSTAFASGKHEKIGIIGSTVELSPRVHAIVTTGTFFKAAEGKRPEVPVVVTRFPLGRLLIARIVEVYHAYR
ncbi:hypothetical protein PP47_gp17 [Pectobacterium phage PP47]|uniref:Uncharacterized protein n=2 Tax=Pektosvirus TaxID=2732689 RepID=A0A3B8GGP0_9CAUD|nr:hypothetical protein HOR48_gp17 [Pectobacterium phage PP81]YP_009788714.1 hypothetical protein HOR52_gp17 [Pectobacterium phage PP47]AYM47371.1 hypothetical protein PP47_gp17 [Pectobacterium phage PP47]AYM47382.1 hypothetical protein PP81_gp17 [Pectobacterium phage PP81]